MSQLLCLGEEAEQDLEDAIWWYDDYEEEEYDDEQDEEYIIVE